MAEHDKATKQAGAQAEYPRLLAPSDDNADPAPLLLTLARVALAVARRRQQGSNGDGQTGPTATEQGRQ